jgi:hypothetical protein
MEATVHLPGAGERHALGASELVIKATGAETAGTFFLSESTLAPGFRGPPPHRHERLVDGRWRAIRRSSLSSVSSVELSKT